MEQGARLLILDNDAGIVELAAWFLERKGYRVRAARSFREARAHIDAEWPDLFLSDIDLGEESGADELPRLAEEGRLPLTLIVSGYLDAELARRLSVLPQVCGTLVKPFDLAVLEQRVEECLQRRAAPVPPHGERPKSTQRTKPTPGAPPGTEEEDGEGWIEIRPFDPRGVKAPERD